jgi:hypothetical protein
LPCIDVNQVESQKKKVIEAIVQSLFIDKDNIRSQGPSVADL